MSEETQTAAKRFRRKKQLEQDLAHITKEMYRQNFELAQTNKTLSLLQKIDSLVLESLEPLNDLANRLCSSIANSTDSPFVAILGFSRHSSELEIYGQGSISQLSALVADKMAKLRINSEHPWLTNEEKSKFIDFASITSAGLEPFFKHHTKDVEEIKKNLPVKSFYIVKLMARQRLVGIMAVGLSGDSESVLHLSDRTLFNRLGEAVGLAVDNKLLFEENQRVVRQLQKTNEKLKALDEAKDEFISMASHQLRTPLTSVKGYVSMVIDGDAGKLMPQQKKLLEQAFASSQRMVYLIADLLNVSRLKTGKFLIEAVPTNLADIVESELHQLKDTAKARNLSLIYTKPDNFPLLNLDQTKIRQVIMNFVDNAIYYTPAGGKISVNLKQTPKSVEFTVVDNGIGVPPAEQHRLFNKFYRAGNARKTRPDGTGLGLFMAKKVVIAQKGAIIFKSTVGKGSTFGFSFPKSK